jgi:multidrug efflux pump subunit AcrA (membrane-fusion protein)
MTTASRVDSPVADAPAPRAAGMIDPAMVEDARQEIRTLIHEITQLSQSNVSLEDFCEGFLTRVVSALAAVGGAMWILTPGARPRLQHQVNLARTGVAESEEASLRHSLLLEKIAARGQSTLVPAESGSDGDVASNPTPHLLVVGVVRLDQSVEAIVEIFQRAGGGPTTHRGYLRFLMQMCDLAGGFLKNRRLRHLHDRQALWEQLEEFTRTVHASLDLRETAAVIANEGRRLIGCDRVSVVLTRGRRCRVEAVSGLDSLDRRAAQVRALARLAEKTVAAGEPVFYTGDDSELPPQLERSLHEYLDSAHAASLAIIPLAPPEEEPREGVRRRARRAPVLGALVIEQFKERRFDEPARRRIETVSQHGALALTKAQAHSRLFLLPLWKMLGRAKWVLEARTLPKALAAAVVVAAIIASLFLVPADFTLAARGTLKPVHERRVFAAVEGVVVDLRVEHEQTVAAGQELIRLRNTDLEVEIASLLGQRTTTQEQLLSLQRTLLDNPRLSPEERERLSGRLLELQESAAAVERRLVLVRRKEEQLAIRSPLAGQVVTWRAQDKLMHRPVERGQMLLTVIDPAGPWELELHLPERRVGHLLRAQQEGSDKLPLTFHLATHPGEEFAGRVTEVHCLAETPAEESNAVRVRAAIDRDALPDLRPGATVNARIRCGRRPLGYVWLHELFEAVQAKVVFWL